MGQAKNFNTTTPKETIEAFMEWSMEETMLAQARGLLIMANGHKANTRLYVIYLNRANEILNTIELMRQQYEMANVA